MGREQGEFLKVMLMGSQHGESLNILSLGFKFSIRDNIFQLGIFQKLLGEGMIASWNPESLRRLHGEILIPLGSKTGVFPYFFFHPA